MSWLRRRRTGCWTSDCRSRFATRSCARRSTARRRPRTGAPRIGRSRRPPTPTLDPDRRAWHRAHATVGPDEDVAGELEQSAGRARARGGLAAAGAFLERAAALTADPGHRARRALEAAATKHRAGDPQAAEALLANAAAGPLDEVDRAMLKRLHGQILLDLRRAADALPHLVEAARRLEPIDPGLARDTHLEAMRAAIYAGRLGPGVLDVAERLARHHRDRGDHTLGTCCSMGWRSGSPTGTPRARRR